MKWLTLLIGFFSATASFAEAIVVKESKVQFLATGRPAMIKIRGESEKLSGAIVKTGATASGVFTFDLKSLKTGVDLRDRHMKEKYLEVDKFPTATLTFKDYPLPKSDSSQSQDAKATLNLHGVDKEVDVKIETQLNGKTYSSEGKFTITLSDFKIQIPTYAGIKVADQVLVSVNLKEE